MARSQSFDEFSVADLWQEHRRWLAVVLLAHRPRGADLEDLLQEVALILTRRIDELRDPEKIRPWLRTIAVNVARGAARRAGAEPVKTPAELDELPGRTSDLERLELRDEARRVLEMALDLKPEFREPLFLRCLHGFSQRRIADILALPETTVETRIARARRLLREQTALHAGRRSERVTLRGGRTDGH